jgi:ATP-dependent helicase/nuclease subunit B
VRPRITRHAPHLEAEARAVATWAAERLHAGKRDLALIALDRETARRVRALLERMDVLAADETGWTLSTTAAAAVIDRWLECVASDFPHVELLDLLKSPFVLGEPAARQDQVLAFELALRRQGVSQGMAEMQRLAHREFAAPPAWLAALFDARQGFEQRRAPLPVWLARAADSLACSTRLRPCRPMLPAPACFDTLGVCAAIWADDSETYGFREWRRWLNLALEPASFCRYQRRQSHRADLAARRARDGCSSGGTDRRHAYHLPARPAPGLFSPPARATRPVHRRR